MTAHCHQIIRAGAALLALAASLAAVHGQTPDPIEQQTAAIERELAEARRLYNHAEYQLAEKLYAQILAFDPGNARAVEGRKLLALTRKSGDGLLASGKILGAVDPNYPNTPTPYDWDGEPWQSDDPAVVLARKSSKIIYPQLSFDGVPLSKAVEWILQESRALDADPNEKARGVTISPLHSPHLSQYELPPEVPAQTDTLIYLRLRNATLEEALEFVGQQAGLRTSHKDDSVSLVQERWKADEKFILAQFRPWPKLAAALNDEVSPKDFSGVFSISAPIEIPRVDAKRFLESQGIQFPPGAWATYFPAPSGGQIFLSDTPENLAKMEKLVEQSENGPVPLPTPDPP